MERRRKRERNEEEEEIESDEGQKQKDTTPLWKYVARLEGGRGDIINISRVTHL